MDYSITLLDENSADYTDYTMSDWQKNCVRVTRNGKQIIIGSSMRRYINYPVRLLHSIIDDDNTIFLTNFVKLSQEVGVHLMKTDSSFRKEDFIWESDQNRTRRTQCHKLIVLPTEPYPLRRFGDTHHKAGRIFLERVSGAELAELSTHKLMLYRLSHTGPKHPVSHTSNSIIEKSFGIPVIDQCKLVRVLTNKDIRRHCKSYYSWCYSVMIDSIFTGTDESTSVIIMHKDKDSKLKLVLQGVKGSVPFKGPVSRVIHQLIGGLQDAMGYTGNRNIEEMKKSTGL
ncbi:unnamed protein product [Brugia pahangi]|uniref:IMPDH domain-containing protein n=1 Tax=Brugia pahangi TaxID=6280 RepID=A0A0N4TW68_BRUPA|nr:unnamed protein product [Brugia pahangi]